MKRALLAALVASVSFPVVTHASDVPMVAVIPYVAPQMTQAPSRTVTPLDAPTKNTDAAVDAVAPLAVPVYQPPSTETTTSLAVAPVVLPAASLAPAPAAVTDDHRIWEIRESDDNFRKLVARWAADAGWKSLWDVPQDVPLAATAPFSGTFKDAIRGALASTELTDYPVHPCFYTNNVVRVVLYSVSCHKE